MSSQPPDAATSFSGRDADVDSVEEASVQAPLDGVRAVDQNGLPGVILTGHPGTPIELLLAGLALCE